ncbi:MAG: DUF1016 N-terminal domain-containing protein [Thermoguttaceae bacterium]
MSKAPKKGRARRLAKTPSSPRRVRADFDEVVKLIMAARSRAVATANTALIDLYWSVGAIITRKIADEGWGKATVETLAEHIQRSQPGATGFSASNLWRMMQFFGAYRDQPELATLLRELSWSHNLAILSRCKRDDEREFYLRTAPSNSDGRSVNSSASSTVRFLNASCCHRQTLIEEIAGKLEQWVTEKVLFVVRWRLV